MRVVLDTNILARAVASPSGPAGEVLDRIRYPHILVTSSQLLAELAEVLNYPRVRALHGRSREQIDAFLANLERGARVVSLAEQTVPTVVKYDPDDDIVVATAERGRADCICTLDKHFRDDVVREYCRKRGIEIMTDIELLQRLRLSK